MYASRYHLCLHAESDGAYRRTDYKSDPRLGRISRFDRMDEQNGGITTVTRRACDATRSEMLAAHAAYGCYEALFRYSDLSCESFSSVSHTLLCYVTSEARANAAKNALDYDVSGIHNGGESRTTCASSNQHTRWSLRSNAHKIACRDHTNMRLSCHTNTG